MCEACPEMIDHDAPTPAGKVFAQVATAQFDSGDFKGHYVYAVDQDGRLWRARFTTWTRGSLANPHPVWSRVDLPLADADTR